jgi:phosphate transport system permease protein
VPPSRGLRLVPPQPDDSGRPDGALAADAADVGDAADPAATDRSGTTVTGHRWQSAPAMGRRPRQSRGRLLADVAGAAGSATALTVVGFGRLADMHSALGFVVTDYLLFLLLLTILTGLTNGRAVIVDRLMTTLLVTAAAMLIGALVLIVAFTLWRGHAALFHRNFWTQDMTSAGPLDPLTIGGISYALIGTAEQICLTMLFTVPLGLACAVYISEIDGPLARFTRTIVEAMTALPSIVAGLFVYVAAIVSLGMERSGLCAALALSVVTLPIITRAGEVVLRLVPNSVREAALANGASHPRLVWHVVLPTARSGLVTAVLMGATRGIGEASPLLLTAGATNAMTIDPVHGPQVSLPLAAFYFVQSPEQTMIARGFAAAAALMIVVLVFFTAARIAGGTGGHTSPLARRRLRVGSARDSARFDARHAELAEAREAQEAREGPAPRGARKLAGPASPPERGGAS